MMFMLLMVLVFAFMYRYLKFTEKNSSQFISVLESKVDITVGSIHRFLQLISGLIITIAIIIALLIINFWATITFSFFFISCYMLLFVQYKKKLSILDSIIALNLKLRVKVIQESISVFRQLKLDKISKEKGWGLVRWITRNDNLRAKSLYDRVSKKTNWEVYEL